MKLLNSFSLQLVTEFPCSVTFEEVDSQSFDIKDCESFIGHQDTANVLGVSMNRSFCTLQRGEEFIVAQLMGGRLPEGSTTLPLGFSFKLIQGRVV